MRHGRHSKVINTHVKGRECRGIVALRCHADSVADAGIHNSTNNLNHKGTLIDGTGKVARVWNKVGVKGHADEVLAAARTL